METKNFKTGQQWRMRCGVIATITDTGLKFDGAYKIGASFVQNGCPYGSIFREDGRYLASEENERDLVELVQDVAEPEPEAVTPDLTTALLEYYRASVAFTNSFGQGDDETLEHAVERERKAEERFDAAGKAAAIAIAAAGVA